MAKSENQKLKLLYLFKILHGKTDEDHSLTIRELIDELDLYGIKAERKTLYSDLEALESFGVDLVCIKSKQNNYHIGSKSFELPELKLLADAVASSKFITEKKSTELIKKIESLASEFEAKQIQRQVVVTNRVKTINEKIYYNVDTLHKAINSGRQINFKYFDIGVDKKKRYRPGERNCSPYALSWEDENYYLIAYYEKYDNIAHFRVDRMENIEVLEERVIPPSANFNMAAYSRQIFSMFSGEEMLVRLQFDNSLVGAVFDKFGIDLTIIKADESNFIITHKIAVSPSFFGWLFQFGKLVKILSPECVQEKFLTLVQENTAQYDDEAVQI
ncbi:MAG TPA: WYL domain-containing protein [Oscillospiraceae bacterium]|nr:WYL domain-containing protein [Oscillospiraceae bacterium]